MLGVLLIQAYLLLDCCDGEVARWRRTTSSPASSWTSWATTSSRPRSSRPSASGPAAFELGGWSTLGVAAGLCAVLIKAESDLVDVARVRSGAPPPTEESAELRHRGLGAARRAAQVLKFHRITGALEVSFLLLAAAVVDAVAGDLLGTRILAVLFAVVAGRAGRPAPGRILLSRRLA